MNNIITIGLDLAKTIFHAVAIDHQGKKIWAKKLHRDDVIPFFDALASKENTTVAMEACGSCHYWARAIATSGFKAILLKPADVKPYAKARQKNDKNDALGIAKAARDPELNHVAIKTVEQQESLLLHKQRERLIEQRILMTNALRATLLEFGVCITLSPTKNSALFKNKWVRMD